MTFELDPERLFIFACALLLAFAAYGLGYSAGWQRGFYGPKANRKRRP